MPLVLSTYKITGFTGEWEKEAAMKNMPYL